MLQNIANVTDALAQLCNDILTKLEDAWMLLLLLCLGVVSLVWQHAGIMCPRRPGLHFPRAFLDFLSQQGSEKGNWVGLS